ncbi:hypothetical protein KM043_001636 [Ampulex compressa]|nr:hypothetical protein KM043_001636 [Ampulex compressa]
MSLVRHGGSSRPDSTDGVAQRHEPLATGYPPWLAPLLGFRDVAFERPTFGSTLARPRAKAVRSAGSRGRIAAEDGGFRRCASAIPRCEAFLDFREASREGLRLGIFLPFDLAARDAPRWRDRLGLGHRKYASAISR